MTHHADSPALNGSFLLEDRCLCFDVKHDSCIFFNSLGCCRLLRVLLAVGSYDTV